MVVLHSFPRTLLESETQAVSSSPLLEESDALIIYKGPVRFGTAPTWTLVFALKKVTFILDLGAIIGDGDVPDYGSWFTST